MRFEKKLKSCTQQEIWDEYCSFLDLSMEEYMNIQKRLLEEQIELMSQCTLGKRLFKNGVPKNADEYRRMVPLTKYEDYADILLAKNENALPKKPAVWLETTWESGSGCIKVAPYSENMLEVYKTNIIAAMILSTSEKKGKFKLKPNENVLYGLAPLPYATGLFPLLIDSEINMHFMPSLKEAKNLSFSQQSKVGFKQASKYGIDLFFGMSSVIYNISKRFEETGFSKGGGGLKSALGMSPSMLARSAKAYYASRRDDTIIKPKDIFKIDGFVCVGTDTALYKKDLEDFWGIRPLEVSGGTEPTCIGTETWSKDGLVLFPDACFYEFIPEQEMLKSLEDESYVPNTYLMDEVSAGSKYEIVITVLKGGAFMRYRVGDVFRCIRIKNPKDGLDIPQFEYVDRIPAVIDIAGFTRITEASIKKVIEYSKAEIDRFTAVKEYDENGRSFLHLFAEMRKDAAMSFSLSESIIREHLSVYFKNYDSDYNDLKRLLGIDPLKVTLLRYGCFDEFERIFGKKIKNINPPCEDIIELVKINGGGVRACR